MFKGKNPEVIKDVPLSDETETNGSGHRVTNNATVALQIGDVKLQPGRSAHFNDFDIEDAKYKAWINANMLSVTQA